MTAARDEDDDDRWSLQEEMAHVFNTSLKRTLGDNTDAVSCISACTKDDTGDYLCKSMLHIWPEIRDNRTFRGPKRAGLALKKNLPASAYDMMERCVVCGPGFVKFILSRQWIAKRIHKMLMDGIDTWAPKLLVKKAIVDFSSRNIDGEMNLGDLRSIIITDTLARMLEYSRVDVLRRILVGDHQEISRTCYEKVYKLLGVHVEEKGKSFYDPYIRPTLNLLKQKGLIEESEGDEVLIIERNKTLKVVNKDSGYNLASTDLAALWHGLNVVKAEWIVYVTDVDQRDYIEMCIIAARRAGWITDNCKYPINHVGFGLVEGDDLKGFQNCSNQALDLLDIAKTRCKAALVEQGKAHEWTAEGLEHTAEALGYGAVKYSDLKNYRLTNYTLNVDEMLNSKGNTAVYLLYTHARICSIIRKSSKNIEELKKSGELILETDEERELGLHLLRFIEILKKTCLVLMPHILCEYLYDLSEKFNSLYSSMCQQIVAGSAEETSNLLLCEATAVVMRKCFHLLGITPIYKI